MGVSKIKNYRELEGEYRALPEPMRWYFSSFPSFMEALDGNKHALSILIIYLFMRIEQAQRTLLYIAMVKKFKINKELAQETISDLYMSRKKFRKLYATMSGKPISPEIREYAKKAEDVRDKILHGKNRFLKNEREEAIIATFEYVKLLNKQIYKDFTFKPFGRLKGFNGRGITHDRTTSEWILIGMGVLSRDDIKKPKNTQKRNQK